MGRLAIIFLVLAPLVTLTTGQLYVSCQVGEKDGMGKEENVFETVDKPPLTSQHDNPSIYQLHASIVMIQTQILQLSQVTQTLTGLCKPKESCTSQAETTVTPPETTPAPCLSPKKSVLGKCLAFVPTALSFDAAKQHCEDRGWFLMDFDQAVIEEFTNSDVVGSYYWIGLKRDGGGSPYTSVSGNDVVFDYSNPLWWTRGGYPSEIPGSDCMVVGSTSFVISNYQCDRQWPFICEIPV